MEEDGQSVGAIEAVFTRDLTVERVREREASGVRDENREGVSRKKEGTWVMVGNLVTPGGSAVMEGSSVGEAGLEGMLENENLDAEGQLEDVRDMEGSTVLDSVGDTVDTREGGLVIELVTLGVVVGITAKRPNL